MFILVRVGARAGARFGASIPPHSVLCSDRRLSGALLRAAMMSGDMTKMMSGEMTKPFVRMIFALAGLLAAADSRVIGLPLGLVRFRFASFVAAFFVLARTVLLVLRATRVFAAVLLLLTRLRTLDEEAAFVVRFALVFAVEAAPVFFVFGLVVFLDLLRATIINLSTRKLSRTRYRSAHEYYPKSVLECYSRNGELTFRPGKSLASSPGTLSDFRSTINWSFSTNPSKNQRRR